MNDPEYVASLEERRKYDEAQGRKVPTGNLIHESTPEVRELRKVGAKIDRLASVVLGMVGGKPIKPEEQRYLTAIGAGGDTSFAARKAKHDYIVGKMKPRQQQPQQAKGPSVKVTPLEGTRIQTK